MIQAEARLWAPERASLTPPPDLALIVLTVLVFGVSGGMLWLVGINYDGLTGSAAQKIHPATYLSIVLLAWTMARVGNPVANAVTALERRPAGLLLGVMGIGLAVQIVVRGGAGIAGAIDTFLLPAIVAILFIGCDGRTMKRIETTIHVVMAVNAALGLLEFVSGQRFFPYRLDGALLEYDTRSVALQGHPLTNATLTACYVVALAAGGGSLGAMRRLVVIGLQIAALVAFGGRSGIVVTLVLGGGLGLIGMVRAVMRGQIPLLAVAGAAFALPLLGLTLAGLAGFGFFDALLGRFVDDGGSANARVVVLDLFGRLSLRELVIGPDPTVIDSMRRINGLAMGLENPIVRLLLYQGAAMTALLTVALALFLYEIGQRCRPGIAMPMITFAVLANTYESVGSKTTLVAKFVILLLALYRAPAPEEETDMA
ncbi:VpsF family polysaccharide biosynthesis protein [Methylobacterium haplocladii]|uniref:Uncharacterized protein n=1 Tax=Methylobacterium haplocladii TaxID=1176176 RepID=A0A512IJD0_9HYPH|nr:VpsF family polysaccharide biosynthesis protein [Methylobacterium haplocladii]GEO97810.1 hypothetical protein MHA02_01980 [Methylobacterium haplocladii]GJD82656.1 hypothetical protein HPGCJGGD_0515 [Methylobacterium haplocladii]GLS57557.1 hypothetical protein GCM10007887_02120 [Methylobacterium haplocladii]